METVGTGGSTLQRLYDSEINFEVSGFYASGFDVRLGDYFKGFLAHGKANTWTEVEAWLREQALAHFPDSKFAQDESRAAPAHLGDSPRTVCRLYGIGPTRNIFARGNGTARGATRAGSR
jgi:hypothetical protein